MSEIGQQTVNVPVESKLFLFYCSVLMPLYLTSDFPVQTVVPVTDEGSSIAGLSGYTLICNVGRNRFLSPSATLAVQWLDQNDAVISEGNPNFTVYDVGPTTNTVLTSRLTFNSLYTSQAGGYSCRTLLTIPAIVDNHTIDQTFTVSVKCKPGIIRIIKFLCIIILHQ